MGERLKVPSVDEQTIRASEVAKESRGVEDHDAASVAHLVRDEEGNILIALGSLAELLRDLEVEVRGSGRVVLPEDALIAAKQ